MKRTFILLLAILATGCAYGTGTGAGNPNLRVTPQPTGPVEDPDPIASTLYAEQLIDAGCPTLKRRPFFQWPVFLDRVAVVGKWTLEAAERNGYPVELIFDDLARNVEPRVLNADAALLRVLSPTDDAYDPTKPLRTAVIAHIFYVEMTDEILDRAGYLPGDVDLIVTTDAGTVAAGRIVARTNSSASTAPAGGCLRPIMLAVAMNASRP